MRRILSGLLLAVYAASTLLFTAVLPEQTVSVPDFSVTAGDLAVLSLNTVYPGMLKMGSRDVDVLQQKTDRQNDKVQTAEGEPAVHEPGKEAGHRVFGEEPAVLIVHTHATETYLPASEGNYHSKEKENSVREVGQVLAESLEEEGISVVHDETLHDSPSYSSSYSRSYETIVKLLEQYPTIECIIDLHRDAIASDGAGAVVSAAGKTCSKYMYVVSTAVPTYQSNLKFIRALNETAAHSFSGFTGSVLERGYAYNQGLSDQYLLLEIGNNRNDIADAKNTARIYGKILAETLKTQTN